MKRELSLSEPYWESYPEAGEARVCEIGGLKNHYRSNQPCKVDAAIADLVMAMNEAGLTTKYCCSALDEDHRSDPDGRISAYIQFQRPLPSSLADLIGNYMERADTVRIHRDTDVQMNASWALIRNAFMLWKNSKIA